MSLGLRHAHLGYKRGKVVATRLALPVSQIKVGTGDLRVKAVYNDFRPVSAVGRIPARFSETGVSIESTG
jgi:hypothetical protein